MRRRPTHILVAAFLLLGQPLLGGCSLISAGLTAGTNAISARKASLSLQELDTVEPGTPLVIRLDDGSEMHGAYAGYAEDRSVLLVQVAEQELRVPVSQVVEIHAIAKKHNVWAAFATGAVVDAAILYTLTQSSIPIGLNF